MAYLKHIFLIFLLAFPLTNLFAQKIDGDSSIIIHKVKKNETLATIAIKYDCSQNQLMGWNKLKDINDIRVGKILWIWKKEGTPGTYPTHSKIDTSHKMEKPNVSAAKILFPHHTDTPRVQKKNTTDDNLAFEGTRVAEPEALFDSSGRIKINGYVSTYYARYSDSLAHGQYQKFPTSCPLDNSFSVNMIYLGAKYISNRFRGNLALHWGDIANCAWSAKYNMIQEANAGFRVAKGLWFDAGYFRTHLGLESIQPRENITSSIATTTYFEPYFLSGAKLTYYFGTKLAIQGSIFNGFNSFVENNKNKAYGLSMVYSPNSSLSITLNSITCDESPDIQKRKQKRIYNNVYLFYKSSKFDFGAEFNYGIQENTKLTDTFASATVISALAVGRFHFNKKLSAYMRVEYFDDRNEMLTGPVQNEFHKLVGVHDWGLTPGIEISPIPNSYLRFEYRYLDMIENDETLFYYKGTYRKYRYEAICSLGFWF